MNSANEPHYINAKGEMSRGLGQHVINQGIYFMSVQHTKKYHSWSKDQIKRFASAAHNLVRGPLMRISSDTYTVGGHFKDFHSLLWAMAHVE